MSLKESKNSFAFLYPYLIIRGEHLTKNDVRRIKRSLAFKMGSVSLVVSVLVILFVLILGLILSLETNFQVVEKYGLIGTMSGLVSILFAGLCITFQVISMSSQNSNVKITFSRLGFDLLYLGLNIQMILMLYGNAEMGFLSNSEAVTPAIFILAILIALQPAFWLDAILLDTLTITSVIGMAIYCKYAFNIQAFYYYIVYACCVIFADYLVISILFYAESQRYCQVLRSERLYNTAMYDELTKCKNRYALRSFLKENQKRWETKSINLLIIMFDIDNFKEYNDQFTHPGGDYCLRTVADEVRKQFQSPDLDFYRYGGEEFLLFFEIRNYKDASDIMKQVRDCVRKLNIEAPEGAPKETVTISAGGSLITCPTDFNWNETLLTVDKSLYKAKAAGKDICCLDGNIIK